MCKWYHASVEMMRVGGTFLFVYNSAFIHK